MWMKTEIGPNTDRWLHAIKGTMYRRYTKRILDFLVSLCALVLMSPLFVALTILGWIQMKGNPFFIQDRPGKNGELFRLIKFRTMTNEKDSQGNLLPADERLVPYGRFLRSTSLDELPELVNVLMGQMSIVGPRPLLVKYLPLYNEHQRRRHEVKPGLTGYAQVRGRNAVTWEERFDMDVWYVDHMTLAEDVKIVCATIKVVLSRQGITTSDAGDTFMNEFAGTKGGN